MGQNFGYFVRLVFKDFRRKSRENHTTNPTNIVLMMPSRVRTASMEWIKEEVLVYCFEISVDVIVS